MFSTIWAGLQGPRSNSSVLEQPLYRPPIGTGTPTVCQSCFTAVDKKSYATFNYNE
jgi:hypothetical protein